MGFPGGSDSKESACNAGDPGSIPGLGRSPGEENSYPLRYSGLENPMDRGAWGGGGLQSLGLQLDTTEQACVKHQHMLRTSCLEGDSFVMVYLMQPVYVANCTCQVVCWAHRGMGADTAPALMIPVV